MNENIIYKAFFDVKSTDEADISELLHNIVFKIRDWLTRKYNYKVTRIDDESSTWETYISGGLIQDQYGNVICKSVYNCSDDGCVIWSGRIEETTYNKGFASRVFVSEIGFRSYTSHSAHLSYCVSYYDTPGFFGNTQRPISPSIPSVVRSIIEDDMLICTVGDSRIHPYALPLSPTQLSELETLVFDPDRIIPIVFIQASFNSPSEATRLADKIVNGVYGNANVYYSTQYISLENATEVWKNGYHCAQGNIRIYLGQVDRSNPQDATRHRYFTERNIEEDGGEAIYRILNRLFCRELSSDSPIVSFDDYKSLIDKRFTDLTITNLKTKISNIQMLKESEIIELKKEINKQSNIIASLETEIYSLREQLENRNKKDGGLFSSLFHK